MPSGSRLLARFLQANMIALLQLGAQTVRPSETMIRGIPRRSTGAVCQKC